MTVFPLHLIESMTQTSMKIYDLSNMINHQIESCCFTVIWDWGWCLGGAWSFFRSETRVAYKKGSCIGKGWFTPFSCSHSQLPYNLLQLHASSPEQNRKQWCIQWKLKQNECLSPRMCRGKSLLSPINLKYI